MHPLVPFISDEAQRVLFYLSFRDVLQYCVNAPSHLGYHLHGLFLMLKELLRGALHFTEFIFVLLFQLSLENQHILRITFVRGLRLIYLDVKHVLVL